MTVFQTHPFVTKMFYGAMITYSNVATNYSLILGNTVFRCQKRAPQCIFKIYSGTLKRLELFLLCKSFLLKHNKVSRIFLLLI